MNQQSLDELPDVLLELSGCHFLRPASQCPRLGKVVGDDLIRCDLHEVVVRVSVAACHLNSLSSCQL